MVRGPSPLLTVALAAVAVVATLVAPALPVADSGVGVRVAATLVAVLVGATVLSAAWLGGGPFIVLTLALGTGMLALAFDAADARAAATVPEAFLWGTAGMLFARRFGQAAVVIGVAVLVAGLALGGVAGDASALTARATAGDPLTLELPAFGGGQAFALPALAVVVLAAIGTWAAALDVRGTWTAVLVLEALALAVALRTDPVAPMLLTFLVLNGDRLVPAVQADDEAEVWKNGPLGRPSG